MARLRILILAPAESGVTSPSNAEELAEQLRASSEVAAVEVHAVHREHRRLGRILPAALSVRLGRSGLGLASAFNAFAPDVVVSWDPEASQDLGRRRAAGQLPVALAAAASADRHALTHLPTAGIDRYLIPWPADRAEAEEVLGGGRVTIVAPPVDPAFREAPAHGASRGWVARQLKLSLKGGRPLILVGGGAGGGGDIAAAVRTAVVTVPEAAVVALAGEDADRTARLERELGETESVRVLGRPERLATVMAAADVLIDTAHASGIEAAAVGCPVVSGGPGLESDLRAALDAPRPEPLDLGDVPSAVEAILSLSEVR